MYNIDNLTYKELSDIIETLNEILDMCSLNHIDDLQTDINSILRYYGSDNLGYTIQKYEELSEICDILGFNEHSEIIEEIERLKEFNSERKDTQEKKKNGNIMNLSFLNEQSTMMDFFTSTKKDFLKFYSYEMTDEEYEITIQDVLRRFDYTRQDVLRRFDCRNIDSISEDIEIDGIMIGKIINSIMMIDWLQERK